VAPGGKKGKGKGGPDEVPPAPLPFKGHVARSRMSRDYRKRFEKLPEKTQELANALFERFAVDPFDPVLGNEELYPTKRGSHVPGSRSTAVSHKHRAIYFVDVDEDDGAKVAVWYWIGSHEDYNNFIGK